MSGTEVPLSLVIKAVDKASSPLHRLAENIKELTAPARKFGKDLHELGENSGFFRLAEGFKGVGEGFHRVGEKAFELGKELGLMALEGGFALFELVKHFVELDDETGKTADRLGMAVNEFAGLRYGMELAGVSAEEFTTAMDKFNRTTGEAADGTGELHKLLQAHLPAWLPVINHAKTLGEKLDVTASIMKALKNPSQQAELAFAAFGKSSKKMVEALKEGPEALAKWQKEYLRVHGSEEENARSAAKLQEAMVGVSTAFSGLAGAAIGELYPSLMQLADVVKEFLADNREGIRVWARDTAKEITEWVKGGGIQRLIDGFKDFKATVQPIVDKLGGWPIVFAGVAAAITAGPLIGALASLAVAFGTLGIAILATPLGWAIALLALVAGAAAFALAKDEALHQTTMKRIKALGDQRAALDAVTDAQNDLNEAMKRDSATPEEIEQLADRLALAKKWAAESTKTAIAAAHDMPGMGKDAPTSFAVELPNVEGARPKGSAGGGASKVVIDINNAPPGTRVATEGKPIDIDVGRSNLGT